MHHSFSLNHIVAALRGLCLAGHRPSPQRRGLGSNGICGIKSIALRVVLPILVILAPSFASAGVDPEKGSYYVSFTDIAIPGGINPSVTRTYDSRASFKGMFGWGWGSNFDTHLTRTADGRVVVHEKGCNKENREIVFAPGDFGAGHVNAAADAIVTALLASGDIATGQQDEYAARLRDDAEFRDRQWEQLKAQDRVRDKAIPEGTRLVGGSCGGYQYLVRVKAGFIRTQPSAHTETFDHNGKLVRIEEPNGKHLRMFRDRQGRLVRVSDDRGRRLLFRMNPEGLVTAIEDGAGRRAEYRYNDQGELVFSKGAGNGEALTYRYDDAHKLIGIDHADDTSLQIAYYGQDAGGKVKSVTERDGMVTEYSYLADPANGSHLTVDAKSSREEGEASVNRYEYFTARREDGSTWLQRKVRTWFDQTTETIYGECCGQPLSITRDGETVTFEYDEKARVIKKIRPSSTMVVTYDDATGKIRSIAKYSHEDEEISWSEFEYDSKGNVTHASNSNGHKIALTYDKAGNIGKIRNLHDDTAMTVKYNRNSRPVVISIPNIGTVNTIYDGNGEIKDVKSSGGQMTALKITAIFQQLLDVIRPASVSLTF